MRKIIKVFVKINKRRNRSFFDRWKLQTELRKTVLENYNQIFSDNVQNKVGLNASLNADRDSK